MSCHKAIVVITGKAHCFHDCIYILPPSYFCEIWTLFVSWITYDNLYYARYFACWELFGSLVPAMCNLTLCAQVQSCHKAIVVITRRAYCFHDCIYIFITPILLLWDLSTLCVVNHLWPLILRSLFCLFSTLWFIGTSNM